jgi:hypothetical protein
MKNQDAFPYGYLDELGRGDALQWMALRPAWAVASISEYDAAFLYGAVTEVKPIKILEVGVASGWGSCIIMHALKSAGVDNFAFHGVDSVARFFYDEKYATGQCVAQMMPECLSRYHLITGCVIADAIQAIGPDIDFAFIDADHMHPWASMDLLAILPYLKRGACVALHDLSLCRKADQLHKNRGPKYLYEGWEGEKMHSVEYPTMIGIIRAEADGTEMLGTLEDILYTPWEVPIDPARLDRIAVLVDRAYGSEWGERIRRAGEAGNDPFQAKPEQQDVSVPEGRKILRMLKEALYPPK